MKPSLITKNPRSTHLLSSLFPYLKRKRILFLCVLVITLLSIAAAFSFSGNSGNDFISYQQNVEVLTHQDGLRVAIDDTVLDQVIRAEKCQKFSASIDGKSAAFLTDTKELYLVHNRTLKKIADDVLHFEISASGMGVAFAQKYAQQYALTLYDLQNDSRREISALLSRLDFSLSPDGHSVAYYTQEDDADILMCHRKGESLTVCRDSSDLVGLSDDGHHIYAVCPKITGTSALFSFNHRGKGTELGTVTSISFKFNADHREIMFYNNGKTMISSNGKPAVKLSSYPLYLVTAPNSRSGSDGNAITLPVDTLFDHIYTCSDGESTSAWLIRKNADKSEKLVSKVSGCTLDSKGKYLYYIHDLSQLCVMNIADGVSQSHTLAENVENYAVTSDRNKLYYTSDGTLYCTNGQKSGKTKIIDTNVASYNLVMSASNVVCYLKDGTLYTCKNGHKANLAAQNIQSVYSSANNVVYIIGDGEVYTAFSKKEPVKILGAA